MSKFIKVDKNKWVNIDCISEVNIVDGYMIFLSITDKEKAIVVKGEYIGKVKEVLGIG